MEKRRQGTEKGEGGDVNCEAEELQDVGKQGKLDYEAEKGQKMEKEVEK